jgi:hypothetical protein
VQARALVNAAGPWAGSLLHGIGGVAHEGGIRLVKGSHIIVPPLYKGDHAFILQNPDGRIVFTIPYQKRFTLVGTTDVLVDEAERATAQDQRRGDRIPLRTVSEYFERQVTPADVVSTYSGVRPLYDDGGDDAKAITRDYVLKLGREEGPQLLSVFGGKLTTYRRLAEHALEKLAPFLPAMGPAWTGAAVAGRRLARRRLRCLPPDRAGALAVPAGGHGRARGPCLWHARRGMAGRRGGLERPGRGFRRRIDRCRSGLSVRARMGADGGGHPVAANQVGPCLSF